MCGLISSIGHQRRNKSNKMSHQRRNKSNEMSSFSKIVCEEDAKSNKMSSFSKILCEEDVKGQMAVNSDFVRNLPQSRGGETVNFPVKSNKMSYFTKILCDTDVKKQLAITDDFVQHLPQSKAGETVNIPVMDVSSGTTREFGYYVRRDGHPKPVFQGGWRDYCRDKGLKVGDKITFWADDGSYRIKAERKIKLMGQEIWSSDL